MSFPVPQAHTFPWEVPLNRHLAQLMNPLTGGINNWDTSPIVGVDGQSLSTRHTGYTGFNTSKGVLERWTGTAWQTLSSSTDEEDTTEDTWLVISTSPYTSALNSKYFVNSLTTFTLPSAPSLGDYVIIAAGNNISETNKILVRSLDKTINSAGSVKDLMIPDTIIELIFTGSTWRSISSSSNNGGVTDEQLRQAIAQAISSAITTIDGGDASGYSTFVPPSPPSPPPTPPVSPTYTLVTSANPTNEGTTVSVTFNTNQTGTFPFTITGISSSDIGGQALTGNFSGNGDTKFFNVTADSTTEGNETFTISLNNGLASTSIVINDTSLSPSPTPTPPPPPPTD